jgi:hypothetical protein
MSYRTYQRIKRQLAKDAERILSEDAAEDHEMCSRCGRLFLPSPGIRDYCGLECRFWSKVDKEGPLEHGLGGRCWVWTASTRGHMEYGQIQVQSQPVGAHVLSYVLHHGIPRKNRCVRHYCHNPRCVNPDHLYADNGSPEVERAVRSRRACGAKISRNRSTTKLSVEKVERMRECWVSGQEDDLRVLSVETGFPTDVISLILQGNPPESIPPSEVRSIRGKWRSMRAQLVENIAGSYDVTPRHCYAVVEGKRWRHVGAKAG